MGHKDKLQLAHVGARVRVANEGYLADDRWKRAKTGTISKEPTNGGALVLIDGDSFPRFVKWADMDIEEKPRGHLLDVPIGEVRPSRWQYRRSFDPEGLLELARSIEEHGLINALLVYRHEEAGFELIAGERRLRACLALALSQATQGLKLSEAVETVASARFDDAIQALGSFEYTVRVELREGTAEDWREVAVVENLQRENPSPMEEAAAFDALMTAKEWTQTQLARHLGKSAGYVSQRLGLLGLVEEAQTAAHDGSLPFASARAIATLPEPVQGAVAAQVRQTMASDEPATTRKVQTMAGQVKRFLDPERWRPGEEDVIPAATRNRYRLMAHHVKDLLARGKAQAGKVVVVLKDERFLGKVPASIAKEGYECARALNVLSGTSYNTYEGVRPWWAAFAEQKGYTCETCQVARIQAPEQAVDMAQCERWKGNKATTCENWIGPQDPVCIFFGWNEYDVYRTHGQVLGLEIKVHGESSYVDDLNGYRALIELAGKVQAAQDAEQERKRQEGHLDVMREYWQAQGSDVFDLEHAQAHTCRYCRHSRKGLEAEGLPPCRYATAPIRLGINHASQAPNYGVLVRDDGLMVPRCEGFQVAEMPAIAPVAGVRFPEGPARGVVLEWLEGLATGRGRLYPREHTMPGVLAWLPYEWMDVRASVDLVLDYVRGHWAECGGDPGVARLLSVAMWERRAGIAYRGSFPLMNPITGELELWAAVGWPCWSDGRDAGYGYPQNWPQPWRAEDE